jgi:pimeloyl-ACP methyl ester carboxylesterase
MPVDGRLPIIFLHGGFHTGAGYLTTPDGRPGWARYFVERGHDVYVPDWPGHGRSPASADFSRLSMREIAQSLAVLADEIGPCIIVAHSAGGPLAWWIADTHPDAVGAIVGIAPGPPSNIQRPLPDDPKLIEALRFDESVGCPVYSPPDKPVFVDIEFIRNFWANTSRFPEAAIDAYAKSIVPESAAVLNERFNIGGKGLYISGPNVVAARPILVVTGDSDPRHPRTTDAAVADYFNAKHAWLPEHGLHGKGHMLMLEDNSEEIACLVSDWLADQGL